MSNNEAPGLSKQHNSVYVHVAMPPRKYAILSLKAVQWKVDGTLQTLVMPKKTTPRTMPCPTCRPSSASIAGYM